MTITHDGKVGIGTDAPGAPLEVQNSDVIGSVLDISNPSANNNTVGMNIQLGPPANATNDFVRFRNGGGTIVGSIKGNAGGVQYNTTSDRRLKSNIRTFEQGLPLVMEMRPAIYERISIPGVDEVGFIAQEMYTVFPQIVTGTPDKPVETPMMLDYGKLTPVLVAAIQEQQAMIEDYRTQVNELLQKDQVIQDELTELKKEFESYKTGIEARLAAIENNSITQSK